MIDEAVPGVGIKVLRHAAVLAETQQIVGGRQLARVLHEATALTDRLADIGERVMACALEYKEPLRSYQPVVLPSNGGQKRPLPTGSPNGLSLVPRRLKSTPTKIKLSPETSSRLISRTSELCWKMTESTS